MRMRSARPDEAADLAALAWAAKTHWGYAADQMERWRADLSPTAASIAAWPTYVAEVDGRAAGFCQVRMDVVPAELEHLWVRCLWLRANQILSL